MTQFNEGRNKRLPDAPSKKASREKLIVESVLQQSAVSPHVGHGGCARTAAAHRTDRDRRTDGTVPLHPEVSPDTQLPDTDDAPIAPREVSGVVSLVYLMGYNCTTSLL